METGMHKEVIGNCELYLGDCRDVLPTLGKVDALATDPPYGVSFTGKSGHYRNQPSAKKLETYSSYDDTAENFQDIIIPTLKTAIRSSTCGIVFMSSRSVFSLPPGILGGIYLPNGCGLSSWGFENFMHAVFYGPDPYLAARKGSKPNGKYGLYGNDSNKIDHPCAKPIEAMRWAVNRVSFEGQQVLDPFMGSGTTGVACAKLGRRFIGIEIEPKYFEIACRRIEDAYSQVDMFIEQPKPLKVEQVSLFAEVA